uniref:C-type lectin domain-containing protein n=1 Tax=Steinernema glaseri TaxID=37863 RepID=A0A1I7XWQ8_9BILA
NIPSCNRDKCFRVVNYGYGLDFEAAENLCQRFGGHLASVDNRCDNALLIANSNGNYWLGLKRTDDKWAWTDGTPYDPETSYNDWAPNQPAMSYLVLNTTAKNWTTAGMEGTNTLLPFICETDNSVKPAGKCPDDSVTSVKGDQCFHFVTSKLANFSLAEYKCRITFGGDLASVHYREDNDKIKAKVTTGFWLGGVDTLDRDTGKCHWKWTDGTPFDYTNWDYSQTFDKPSYRLIFNREGRWQSSEPQVQQHYVCGTKPQ